MRCTSSNRPLAKGICRLTPWLGVICFLNTCGCFSPVAPESPQTRHSPDGPKAARLANSTQVEALADRLKAITEEVEQSTERRVYGVHVAANYQADQKSPLRVCKVAMSVNVYWCDDGCVDGPADTPAKDDDLLLLRPFAETLRTLDLQCTEITDLGLQTVAELNLNETKVEPDQLQALGALSSLRTVLIPAPAITDEVLAVLGRLPHLQSLVLANSPISDRGLESLARRKSLQMLDLSATRITDRGLAHLADLTSLTQLRLSQTPITGAGLAHLGRLTHLQELELAETLVDDAGLAHLSDLRQLRSLQLAGTRVRGFGLAHLRDGGELRQVTLPPIPATAVQAVNAVKSWHTLALTLAPPDDPRASGSAAVVTINDMPELSHLRIQSESPLDTVNVVNCPRLSALVVMHNAAQRPGAAVQLGNLPALRDLYLDGSFRQLADRAGFGRVARLVLYGALASDLVHTISRFQSLDWLDLTIADVLGDPLPIAELSTLPHVQAAQVRLETMDASWVVRLIGKMPALQRLDLRGQGLTAQDLAPLSHCTQLTEIYVRGIDDPGEPLTFLDAMPRLDQCLVLGCPSVGRVRLTERTGVRRFYFKYGQLNELEIDGAPNLTAVYLGHEAFGYDDHDAKLPKLDIRRLAVRNAANLLYLMVDGKESKLPFTEIGLADCPKLRSLTLRAPPPEIQPLKCRFAAGGTFSQLAQRRLFHLATDQQSLARLNDSQFLRGGDIEDVQIEPTDKE
jgi:Leucine-rich repeat (LRR) protein